jgi:3-oxoacyl-[acyl-carrier-protein] synthase II
VRRVGVFGWGIVAPRSPNVDAFAANLARSESWLSPFDGYGPCNFLVGNPEFRFDDYRDWFDQRFPPARFPQLADKMDAVTQFALGAFIQSLGQNPGLEEVLQELGLKAHVYVGTGLGNLPTVYRTSIELYKAQRRWDRFWADPERNAAMRHWLDGDAAARSTHADAPPDPRTAASDDRDDAEETWSRYWAERSDALARYLGELREAEAVDVVGDVEKNKLNVIRQKTQRFARIQKAWGAPDPPWLSVSTNLLWNISNIPAAQISMAGRLTGLAFAPIAACSTFGVALKLGMDAIRRGDATAVVLGASDPPPHPLSVGAFYGARVIAADAEVSKPLGGLRGTHVAGGAAIWIIGDWDHMIARGFTPLGMEPLDVGVSSDAHHIITPTKDGPIAAIRQAMERTGTTPSDIETWDLHATATPGDYLEVENLLDVMPKGILVTARKGTFGHGMSACGGWELTAQYLGVQRGDLFPTPLSRDELNAQIKGLHGDFVFDAAVPAPCGVAGKMSMGVGGINACVLSRPIRDR